MKNHNFYLISLLLLIISNSIAVFGLNTNGSVDTSSAIEKRVDEISNNQKILENDISNLKDNIGFKVSSANSKEDSYYKTLGAIQTTLFIFGTVLTIIIGFGVWYGLRDMKTIKQNAHDTAKEEATSVAKNEAKKIATEIIDNIFKNEVFKNLNNKNDELTLQVEKVSDSINLIEKRLLALEVEQLSYQHTTLKSLNSPTKLETTKEKKEMDITKGTKDARPTK